MFFRTLVIENYTPNPVLDKKTLHIPLDNISYFEYTQAKESKYSSLDIYLKQCSKVDGLTSVHLIGEQADKAYNDLTSPTISIPTISTENIPVLDVKTISSYGGDDYVTVDMNKTIKVNKDVNI